MIHICNLSAGTARWETETGEPLEALRPARLECAAAARNTEPLSVSDKAGGEDPQLRLSSHPTHVQTCNMEMLSDKARGQESQPSIHTHHMGAGTERLLGW